MSDERKIRMRMVGHHLSLCHSKSFPHDSPINLRKNMSTNGYKILCVNGIRALFFNFRILLKLVRVVARFFLEQSTNQFEFVVICCVRTFAFLPQDLC